MFVGIISPTHSITAISHEALWSYLAEIAQINILHCVFNIFQWIIIKLGGNVCWLITDYLGQVQ